MLVLCIEFVDSIIIFMKKDFFSLCTGTNSGTETRSSKGK